MPKLLDNTNNFSCNSQSALPITTEAGEVWMCLIKSSPPTVFCARRRSIGKAFSWISFMFQPSMYVFFLGSGGKSTQTPSSEEKIFGMQIFEQNLIRQLAGIEESTPPPQGQFRRLRSSPSDPVTQMHLSAATR